MHWPAARQNILKLLSNVGTFCGQCVPPCSSVSGTDVCPHASQLHVSLRKATPLLGSSHTQVQQQDRSGHARLCAMAVAHRTSTAAYRSCQSTAQPRCTLGALHMFCCPVPALPQQHECMRPHTSHVTCRRRLSSLIRLFTAQFRCHACKCACRWTNPIALCAHRHRRAAHVPHVARRFGSSQAHGSCRERVALHAPKIV